MRQKNTDPFRSGQRRDARRGVAAGLLLWVRRYILWRWLDLLLLLMAAADLISIPFSLVVLRQRMREIERGELDEARKY